MKLLIIDKPYIDKRKLCANILIGKKTYNMWFEVEEEYVHYLCISKLDAFLIAILPYAIKHELDIKINGNISSKLYYQLTKYLIPLLCNNFKKRNIKIESGLDSSYLKSERYIGTGISCGIDSFYTICKHIDLQENEFNVNCLTFFNAGASGEYGGEESRKLYNLRKEQSRKFAIENNFKFVCVDTNMNEFLMMNHEKTHTFRSLACVLAIQQLFSKYYYSSGLNFNETKIDEFDTSYYDILNMQCLSNENIEFYCPGIETTRIDKVKQIVKYKPTYQWLNVCVKEEYNCGKCEKCIRTLLELDAIGEISKYKKIFNLEDFYKKRNKYIAFMLKEKRKKNVFYIESYNEYKKRNVKIPFICYLLSYKIEKKDIKNLAKKILPYDMVKKIKKKKNKEYIDDGWI